MKRETLKQLQNRMSLAEWMVPAGSCIRHVRTGGEYIVHGHSLRAGDLGLMVNYSPLHGSVVVFSREASAVQSKFVMMDQTEWRLPVSFNSWEAQ